ncbi:hypothetical protein H0H87_007058 [Tephrocybe sp. NHM501043]|nr:hypothetical protein H0H87_007058 [Tephrocybe sp. NHM501043]
MRLANLFSPPPAPPGFGAGKVLPESDASYFSRLIFHWLVPFLDVGFSRPIEKDDLWELPPHQLTSATTDALLANFYARCKPETLPESVQLGSTRSISKEDIDEKTTEPVSKPVIESQTKKPRQDWALFYALHSTFRYRIWLGGFLKFASDTLKTTTPLVTKVLLTWLTKSYAYHRLSDEQKASGEFDKPQGIGYGIGIAVALFAMQDSLVALGRISKFLLAEELAEPYLLNYEEKSAVSVDGDFTWETAGKLEENKFGVGGKNGSGRKGKNVKKISTEPRGLPITVPADSATASTIEGSTEDEKPFELKDLKFSVPKGSFVAIVGRVGSGKSSLLQALIGEMRKTRGEIVFGGTAAYVPQTAWIRNATLRENVLFGQEDDEQRFRDIIRACNLEHDLEMLPQGENTEIGEKGINLSGGQKARVSLARAAYSQSEVILLDDPLSAVDAYVGRAILDQCLLNGPLAYRTRILVTHSLHVLDKTDYIYVMDSGMITEQGTYDSLINNSVLFSRLMDEYGNLDPESEGGDDKKAGRAGAEGLLDEADRIGKKTGALMQAEERNTGSVTWDVYRSYLRFAGGIIWAPIIIFLLTLSQGSQVVNNVFLGFWTVESIQTFRQGDYMAVYAAIGVAQAILAFMLSFAFALASLAASLNLFKTALTHVLRSPISFFDTTPIGRILSRLSKDQDTLDSELASTLWQFLTTFTSVLGTVALVFYTFPYLGIIFVPMTVIYWIISVYYRSTSVETKRLDSLMRSTLYATFSETLTGLSTIRAYRAQDEAVKDADNGLDLENRAYYMTISIQRWLTIRLDVLGNVLVFGIALFAAGFRNTVDPSKIGVVLSYTLSITQVFSDMVAQFAQNEQNMNAVERVLHYAELAAEGDVTTPSDPPMSWPSHGRMTFENVKFAYRKGLPLVLKGVTFNVNPGEKVGIVGRTGAGKSSLLQALFRTVDLESGKIEIDGLDISSMGLDALRGRLALVPQDSTLFLGTLRDNLGQDEATSSVDVETDAKLQKTIQKEFSTSTLLCIAHRLNTIGEGTLVSHSNYGPLIMALFVAYYDRVLVMDAGEVAEFDTVLNLYDNEQSIFRSLCNEANLQRTDILRIRANHSDIVAGVSE